MKFNPPQWFLITLTLVAFICAEQLSQLSPNRSWDNFFGVNTSSINNTESANQINYWQKMVNIYPNSLETHLRLAQAYFLNHQTSQGHQYLIQILQIFGPNPKINKLKEQYLN